MTGRRIVVHRCGRDFPRPDLFKEGDVVFFDDCLYSQYRFFEENIAALSGVTAVFAFSPGLFRRDGQPPIDDVDSAEVHKAVNARVRTWLDPRPDQARAFMTAAELRSLARLGSVKIALHGCVHLRLEDVPNRTDRLVMFRQDARDAVRLAALHGFETDMFVYPYAFCEDGYEHVLRRLGFRETYARPGAYRIAVEDLSDERAGAEDS